MTTTAEPTTGRAPRITRDSLMTLEAYARARADFRAKVLAHKRDRTVHLGEHVTLLFEDELTMRYQIQEMLRIEKIFDDEGIQGEIDAYDPLVPDGANLKATMLIEYEDADERQRGHEAEEEDALLHRGDRERPGNIAQGNCPGTLPRDTAQGNCAGKLRGERRTVPRSAACDVSSELAQQRRDRRNGDHSWLGQVRSGPVRAMNRVRRGGRR